ncbi:MAG: Spy/CpxP family protein refolding chaperone [Thermodesulfobacteriota bacterium]
MKISRIITVLCMAGAIAASPAMAHREMRAGYGSGPGNVEDIAEAQGLDLTAAQRERIDALREAHLREIKPLQEQLYVRGRELRQLWLDRHPDRDSILALQREVRGLRRRLMEKLTTYRLDAWQLLTPEQQEKVRPYGPGRGPGRMGGPGMRGDDEHNRGMRRFSPSGAGAAP